MRFSNNAKSSKQMDNGALTALISQLWFSKQFPATSKTIQTHLHNSGWWEFTWVGRRVVCRRHVRQGSAASSGLGSGSGGTRGQRTRENLFHWPEGKSRERVKLLHQYHKWRNLPEMYDKLWGEFWCAVNWDVLIQEKSWVLTIKKCVTQLV